MDDKSALRRDYGTPSHNARAVYQKYMGDAAAAIDFFGLLDNFTPDFEVIEPLKDRK